MILFYRIFFLPLMYLGLSLASLFNAKIRSGFRGRTSLFTDLYERTKAFGNNHPRFWIHNSSMGEFEQAKPIVQHLKETFPNCFIAISFFSPSAYDHVQSYTEADCLCYLPLDTSANAKRFIDRIEPDVAIMIRHDFWPNHLLELKKRKIPILLVNASIRPRIIYKLWPILSINRFLYSCFDWVLAVSRETINCYKKYDFGHAELEVAGDTRHDQVIRRAREAQSVIAHLKPFKKDRLCFVMGSTWPSDETILFDAISRLIDSGHQLNYIVVPHEPHEEHLKQIEVKLSLLNVNIHRLSTYETDPNQENDVLLVDRIGILASLYQLANITYVGGSFGPGVHNVLEPAAFGKPVLFGPRSDNSFEAGQLAESGGGFLINSSSQVFDLIHNFIKYPESLKCAGQNALQFIQENRGATERIVSRLRNLIEKS